MICDHEEKAVSLLENKEKGETPTLSCLVLFNACSDAVVERGKDCGVEILQLTQLMVREGWSNCQHNNGGQDQPML